MLIGAIGCSNPIGESIELGTTLQPLEQICRGEHWFLDKLAMAKKPIVLLGDSILGGVSSHSLFSQLEALSKQLYAKEPNWAWLNFIHQYASSVAMCDLGFVPGVSGRGLSQPVHGRRVIYLLGADSRIVPRQNDDFIIYQGHHGDVGAQQADIILPGSAFTEKSGLYVNTEGRGQMTRVAVSPPGEAREDWQIIAALAHCSGHPLKYTSLDGVRARLFEIAPQLANLNQVEQSSHSKTAFILTSPLPIGYFSLNLANCGSYYQTDVIAKNSPTMAKCAKQGAK